jgi:glutathione S-transferase
MAQYIEVEQAVSMSGLRLVLVPGIPSPWGEAIKGICQIKKIPFVRVRQEPGGANLALVEWTRQTSAPVAVWNDERPRSTWLEQLDLAERLAPQPRMIPSALEDRVRMIGLCNEICGENGLGWSARLIMLHGTLTNPKAPEAAKKASAHLGAKYGYSPEAAAAAPARCAAIIAALGTQLATQKSNGRRFLIGEQLSALDVYWATFSALIEPLPEALCPMPPAFRRMYTSTETAIREALTPELLAHRDFIYHEYLELPVDL